MSSLQKMTTNLCQVLRLHEYRNSNMPGLEKLGAIDIYYLEAIYQLKDPTIGRYAEKQPDHEPKRFLLNGFVKVSKIRNWIPMLRDIYRSQKDVLPDDLHHLAFFESNQAQATF